MTFRPLRRGFWVLAASVAALALAGGIAYATIPNADGVIHACFKATDATKTGGATLNVVDSERGATCKDGETALTVNQQGPQGPAGPEGPSDAYSARGGSVALTDSRTVILARDVPDGSYAITARVEVFTGADTAGPRFVSCTLLDTANQAADNMTVQLATPPGGPNGAAGLPLIGTTQTFVGGTLRIECAVSPFSSGDYVAADGNLIAIRVGSLH